MQQPEKKKKSYHVSRHRQPKLGGNFWGITSFVLGGPAQLGKKRIAH